MRIESMKIQNFRCIHDEELKFDKMTVLIGPNCSGKSTFLQALNVFYDEDYNFNQEDFFNRDYHNSIIIAITYSDLSDNERLEFAKYFHNNNLTVEKRVKELDSKGKYHGYHYKNLDFDAFRNASGSGFKQAYSQIRNTCPELPNYTNKDEAETSLQAWENNHNNQCQLAIDDGQFFGFRQVGRAKLEKWSKYIFLRAVYDASEEANEQKGSILADLMNFTIWNKIGSSEEYSILQQKFQREFQELIQPLRDQSITQLETELTNILHRFVNNVIIRISLNEGENIKTIFPKAEFRLSESSINVQVKNTGHGLQRLFLLTLIQYFANSQIMITNPNPSLVQDLSNLIIGIEEPEIYQHPNQQRNLAEIFPKLTDQPISGLAHSIQIIYSTHSPLFLNIEHFNNIRLCQKHQISPILVEQTKITYTTMENVAQILQKAQDSTSSTFTAETLRARLISIMTPWMNEGFFAKKVVLVEGEEDRAVINGLAKYMDINVHDALNNVKSMCMMH